MNISKLIKQLDERAEFWRTAENDPQGIATAVYTALAEAKLAVIAASKPTKKLRHKK